MQMKQLAAEGLRRFRNSLSKVKRSLCRLTRSNERATRQSIEHVHIIARALAPASYDVRTVMLQAREQSQLYRYDIYTDRSDAVLRIVEKRSSNSREHVFYRCLEMLRGGHADVAPKMYGIHQSSLLSIPEFRTHFFLEYIPNIGLPDLSDATATKLAQSMIKIAGLPIGEAQGVHNASTRRDVEFLDQFLAVAIDNGHVGEAVSTSELNRMETDWHSLSERELGTMYLVPCHNDLHRMNLGRRDLGRNGDFVFFDWEHFALNQLGSDLHHFISSGLVMEGWSKFSATLQNEYGRLAEHTYGISRNDLHYAAYSYTLYKCMIRSIRRKKDALQIRAAVAIFDRLRGMVCILAVIVGEEII